MAATTNRNPARRIPETSSLMGAMEIHPRTVIVWVFLTITVAVAGWRIFRDGGAPRMEAFAAEAVDMYAASPARDAASQPPGTEEAERRILEMSGVSVNLPHDDAGFVVTGLDRETIRNRDAAALRFRYGGGYHLLIMFRQDRFLGGRARAALPDESILSGERDGRSFVLWERGGAFFIMVSDVDEIRAFSLVRRFFT